MSDPLATWKAAKTTFEAKVKNNKNTKKPGSWFTTGTDSAIKKVIAIVYDGKQPPAYKKSRELEEKLRLALEKEYAKIRDKFLAEATGLQRKLYSDLKKKGTEAGAIEAALNKSKEQLKKVIKLKLARLENDHEAKLSAANEKSWQVFDGFVADLTKQHQTQLVAWRKHMADYQKQLNDAKKSKDYDDEYKQSLPILDNGLKAVDKELKSWPFTNWEAWPSRKKEEEVDYDVDESVSVWEEDSQDEIEEVEE